MALKIFQTPNQDLMLMQKQWTSQLNPILMNPILQGLPLNGISLTANVPLTVNHYLGRQMMGYLVTNQNANAVIWSTKPLNNTTLTLESNANVTISLWVF